MIAKDARAESREPPSGRVGALGDARQPSLASPDLAARRFFLVLFVATALLLAAVIRPFVSALITAAVLAGMLWPVQCKLTRMLRDRRAFSAGVLVFGVVLIIAGPVAGLSAFVLNEASGGIDFVTNLVQGEGSVAPLSWLPESLRASALEALKHLPQAQGAKVVAAGWAAVSATGQFAWHTGLMLIALYFLLLQGDAFVRWLDQVSPLRSGQTRELLADFKRVSFAVVVSTVVTAAVQTVVAVGGYYIARVPHPIFFGALTFFCAVIPAVGAASVSLVAALILVVTGHPYMAIFLAIWGLAVVGMADNVVKPLLLKGGMHMPGVVVFFALLGGLAAFGLIGLLLGPLVVSLFVALLRMYERDFGTKAAGEPTPTA